MADDLLAAHRASRFKPKTSLRTLPAPASLGPLGLFGPFNPIVRKLTEMLYLSEAPFVVDSGKIADRLRVRATPIEQTLAGCRNP